MHLLLKELLKFCVHVSPDFFRFKRPENRSSASETKSDLHDAFFKRVGEFRIRGVDCEQKLLVIRRSTKVLKLWVKFARDFVEAFALMFVPFTLSHRTVDKRYEPFELLNTPNA